MMNTTTNTNQTDEKDSTDLKKSSPSKIRFNWLDQFRGLVILLFIIQTLAWKFSGNPSAGIPPVFAPHLNHGYKYINIAGMPPIITLIDVGQQIFIFLVGYMAAFSVIKLRANGKTEKEVWIRIIRRFIAILILNAVHMTVQGTDDVASFVFDSTLGMIAWAGLIAAICTLFVSKSDLRLVLGLIPLVIQFILSLFTSIPDMWSELLAHIAIGIIATAYTGWMLKGDGSVDDSHFKDRVLPVTFSMFTIMYLVEFIQWADHHGATVPVATMAIGLSGIAVYIFYKIEQDGYQISLLTTFGKNLLMMFLLEMVIIELVYIDLFLVDFVRINPWLDLILAGVIPILILWILAKILAKYNLYLRV
jgi:predicted acyltransferase